MTPLLTIAADQKSAEVTDWAARVGWLVGLVLFVALVYWLMREGWKWRGTLQGDLPELPSAPSEPGEATLTMSGRYHGSTTATTAPPPPGSGSTGSWRTAWAPAAGSSSR